MKASELLALDAFDAPPYPSCGRGIKSCENQNANLTSMGFRHSSRILKRSGKTSGWVPLA